MPEHKLAQSLNLDRFNTYEQLKALALAHRSTFTPQQNWAIVERMRQLRYGYKQGELSMDRKNTKLEILTVQAFRARKELEDADDLRKYGPV